MRDVDPGLWYFPHDAVSEGELQRVHTWCCFLLPFELPPHLGARCPFSRLWWVQPLCPNLAAITPHTFTQKPPQVPPAPPLGQAQGGFRGCCLITPHPGHTTYPYVHVFFSSCVFSGCRVFSSYLLKHRLALAVLWDSSWWALKVWISC